MPQPASRDEFERWLRAPLDEDEADLRARIEQMACADRACARLRDEWRRLDAFLRAFAPTPGSVDWRRLSRRIAQRIRQPRRPA